jgi:hypothetical protein
MQEPQQVSASLDDFPKDVKKVVEAMEQQTQKRVSTTTIKRFIKKSQRWKQINKAPAPSPEPHQSRRRQALMARLHVRASHGACALWSGDGTGGGLEPSLPYAWQPRGASIAVPTSSPSRRLHV